MAPQADQTGNRSRMAGWLAPLWMVPWLGCAAPPALPGAGSVAQPIVNGQLTTGDPAVVYLDVGCTGTLVSSHVVLTACHCLQGAYYNVDVFFGSDINGQGTWIDSVHHEIYPADCIGDGDLGMLTLSAPGPATPIPIGSTDLAAHVGEAMRIVGFGVTGENSGGSGLKREGWTTLSSADQGQMWSSPSQQSGTCYGDSGGPNFMTFGGVEYVAGTTSYGTEACGSGLDAAARTDSHFDWLMQYIADQDPADCGADSLCATGCGAPDPDCPCAGDGFCTDACPDAPTDPDCGGCQSDGSCRPDCPEIDLDCCVADSSCTPGCGALDPDCDGGSGGADGQGGGPSSSGEAGGPSQGPGGGAARGGLANDGLVGVVGCSAARPGRASAGRVGWRSALWLLALVGLSRRRTGR